MGYLSITSSEVDDFNKAVMSVWFYIPQETLDLVRGIADSIESDFDDVFCGVAFSPPLAGIIPLITFGSLEVTLPGATPGGGASVSPSFIGIDFSHPTTPHVAVNLQTSTTAVYNKPPTAPEDEYRPAAFYMQGWSVADSQALPVTGDQWHHILISFDISSPCDVTHRNDPPEGEGEALQTWGPTFSWAFDDEGKVGNSMVPSGGQDNLGAATNNIIPQIMTLWRSADFVGEGNTDFIVTYSGMDIGQSGSPMGVPASAGFVDSIYNIMLGDVQVFTGVTLDATSTDSRRAFITSGGAPASPLLSQSLFGKEPEVLLIGGQLLSGTGGGTGDDFDKTGTIIPFGTLPHL